MTVRRQGIRAIIQQIRQYQHLRALLWMLSSFVVAFVVAPEGNNLFGNLPLSCGNRTGMGYTIRLIRPRRNGVWMERTHCIVLRCIALVWENTIKMESLGYHIYLEYSWKRMVSNNTIHHYYAQYDYRRLLASIYYVVLDHIITHPPADSENRKRNRNTNINTNTNTNTNTTTTTNTQWSDLRTHDQYGNPVVPYCSCSIRRRE